MISKKIQSKKKYLTSSGWRFSNIVKFMLNLIILIKQIIQKKIDSEIYLKSYLK